MTRAPDESGFDPRKIERLGPYEVVRYVAEGGMAWVYEARDPRFPARRLALKVLKPRAGHGELFQRFVAEANLLAGVDHPNLVTIFDLARDEATGLAYYTMSFVEGESLARAEPMPWREALPPFLGLLEGLAELHDRGVIHRDIKPGNMLLRPDGRALLADLGIARDPGSQGLTRVGTVLGTPAYMPPEQAAGRSVDARADLFAIGMSIYRVVTGRTVYDTMPGVDSKSGPSILSHLAGCSSRSSELEFPFPDGVPGALREVIRRACRFDPGERFESARALRAELARILDEDRATSPGDDPSAVTAPRPVVLDPRAVERIAGYEVVRFVAEGGMGWVFEVRAAGEPDRRLALKALKPALASDEELRRFRAEAELMSGLEHPNLVGVLDTGVDPATGISFYTMPFIDARPLSEHGSVDVGEALRIVDGVLTGLAELHRRGIVHRDVKPANILLQPGGSPRLTDLGIARNSKQATMTSTGVFLGTALYCSPEQARGARVGPESDVFSVGLLLHRLVTGRSAYAAVDEVDVQNDASILFHLARLDHSGEELVDDLPASVPPAVAALVARACRYRPEDRYPNAVAMRTELRAARRDPTRVAGRRGRAPVTLAALAVGAALTVGLFWIDWRGSFDRLGTRPSASQAAAVPTEVATEEARAGADDSPLRVVARSPESATVPLEAEGATRLRVEVDAGDETLFFDWRVDGRRMATNGPELVIRDGRSAEVEVIVTDGRGRSVVERWTLEGANQKPRLALVPAGRRIQLEVGDRRTFAARVSDPDGDPVTVAYEVDGRIEAEGTGFVFQADRPGTYRLVVRARDARGATRELQRLIRVVSSEGQAAGAGPLGLPAALAPRAGESLTGRRSTGSATGPAARARAARERRLRR